jgi:hypothetical protein
MAKPLTKWTVYPHGPIEKLEDNLWRVEQILPGTPITRTLVVVRLADGRLVIHNGIALGDAEMKELEAFGRPAFLIVPNAGHRLDARIYKDRYPDLVVVAPPGARAKVEEVVKVDTSEPDFGDPNLRYEVLEGTAGREGVLSVRTPAGVTLVMNDVISNMRRPKGFKGVMVAMFGFTGPVPKVSPLPRMLLVKDKKALRAHLERLAATEGLARLIVAHGALVERPADAIRAAAQAGL